MTVTIAVPLGESEPWRDRAWEYMRRHWERVHPSWPIVTGLHRGSKYRKGVAVADALSRVATPLVLLIDADIIVPDLGPVVDALTASGRAWAKPHSMFTRLTQGATRDVYAGADPIALAGDQLNWDEPPYRHCTGGGAVLIRTECAREVPFDPRFEGWGGADWSWGWALTTLLGAPVQGARPAVHLWHPPQARLARQLGSVENEALKARYRAAQRRVDAMREIVAEARRALSEEQQAA